MKPDPSTVIAQYNKIAQLQRNNGLTIDRVLICNLIAAQAKHRFADVLEIMEGEAK
jgi:hypothetical protein